MEVADNGRKNDDFGYFGKGASGYAQYRQTFVRLSQEGAPARAGTKPDAGRQREKKPRSEQEERLARFQDSVFETNFNHTRWLALGILMAVAMILGLIVR